MIGRAAYHELVYGGHLLALGTSSIASTVALVMDRQPTVDLALMAYLFTYGAYTVNRVTEADQDRVSHPDRTAYLDRRRKILPAIAAGCFVLGYALAYERNLYFLGALVVPLVLAVLYSVGSEKMRGITGTRRLKEGLLVKNVVISFGWSLIPFLVGLYYLAAPVSLFAVAPFIFMRLMGNTIFFDERDVEGDSKFGTRTIPSTYGRKVAGRVMLGFDLLSGVYVVAAVALSLLPGFALLLVVFPVYSVAYRYAANRANANVMRDFVADGEYILWLPVILLGKI